MLIAFTNTILSTNILLDCSTTSHMLTSKEHFITNTESSNKFVTVDSYNKVSVAGQGLVLFFAKLPSGWLNSTLYDVLHILYLSANLISLSVLYYQGVSVQSFNKELILFKNSKKLFKVSLIGSTRTLYHIQCTFPVTGTAYLASGLLSIYLQYQHMGHLSLQAIDFIQCQNLVKGLEISIPHEFDHICSSCTNDKSHYFPFPDSSSTCYTKIELIVMDITGPILVSTQDSFLYALAVVEVSCKYLVERLLYTKKDTSVAVCNILVILERQSKLKVHCLYSDNGLEFVNDIIYTFYYHNRIIHETTILYTPEQNKITEQAIAIFFEMVCSMLYTTNVNLQYWGEAFSYIVYIRSMSITSGLNGIILYETWTGHKSNISHLQVFGSLGQTHVLKQVCRGKLESQIVKVQILDQ